MGPAPNQRQVRGYHLASETQDVELLLPLSDELPSVEVMQSQCYRPAPDLLARPSGPLYIAVTLARESDTPFLQVRAFGSRVG